MSHKKLINTRKIARTCCIEPHLTQTTVYLLAVFSPQCYQTVSVTAKRPSELFRYKDVLCVCAPSDTCRGNL